MRAWWLLAMVALAGCQSTKGPFETSSPQRVDDPLFSASDQKARSRYLLAFPEYDIGPKSGAAEPPLLGPYNQ
jgi:hypothetical protein